MTSAAQCIMWWRLAIFRIRGSDPWRTVEVLDSLPENEPFDWVKLAET